jgi:hypothetical protein
MLELAGTNCPDAELLAGDVTSIELFDRYHGIVAWDSIFRIPKAQHGALFQTLYERLRPGAPVLLSLGGSENEFTASMFDVDFFYSGHSPDVSAALLREAGLRTFYQRSTTPHHGGTSQFFVARRFTRPTVNATLARGLIRLPGAS